MPESIVEFFSSMTLLNYFVISINLLLIIFARPIIRGLSQGNIPQKKESFRINLLRGLNLIIIVVYQYQHLYAHQTENNVSVKLLAILVILYVAHVSNYFAQHFVNRYYGKSRVIRGDTYFIPTYQTRLFSILAAIFITVVALILIIQQLGFDSLLKAGGAIGVIGVMLGLTQASWAPDIISGLIILNSNMFEEGDIIDIEDGTVARVFKTKLFHTEILKLTNNHRIMIRNASMRDMTIHNLSKFASSRGLRECLQFNIGYDVDTENVKALLTEAFNRAAEHGIPLEHDLGCEVRLFEAGDHALNWGILYYIKQVDQIIEIRRQFREIILQTATEKSISLATPFTHAPAPS